MTTTFELTQEAPAARYPIDDLPENTRIVLAKRYLKKDAQARPLEQPRDMFWRVACNLAEAERRYGAADGRVAEVAAEFFEAMARLEYVPNSPTLMNAGRDLQQLSACFVLPVEDSIEGIFDAVKWTAMIHKSGGGTGFSFSRLRPRNDFVQTTTGIASGPVSFMKIFNAATEEVKQGGTRRGANMGMLRVDHPDIMDFITCKADMVSVTNFNISVAITEAFMRALDKGEDFELISPRTGEIAGHLNARQVFDTIVDNAWKNGDPGLVFLDRINAGRANPVPAMGPVEATNPCGEQPLYPFDSCNLGSINLARFVQQGPSGPDVDWERLGRCVATAVRCLDNVIDMNRYPVPQIQQVSNEVRRIGLGIMGWADLLIELGIPYNSQPALDKANEVMSFIQQRADDASETLAAERGVFPAWEKSIYGPQGEKRRLRNSTRTTIAPTGTISIIAGCSSGIEPLFAICFERNVLDGTRLVDVNPTFERIAKQEGFYSPELMAKVADSNSIQDFSEIPAHVRRVFVTAHDVGPEWHVRIQAAFQNYTDNAVSKTINFPHEATREDVARAYLLAYEEQCKGITIYRDGSRDVQVLSTGHTAAVRASQGSVPTLPDPENQESASGSRQVRSRPRVMHGVTERIRTGHGTLYVTLNMDDEGHPFELFSNLGKAGGCDSAQLEAISRLVSLALRSGISPREVIDQLRGITCCPTWDDGVQVRSAPDAVALALERHTGRDEPAPEEQAHPYALQMGFFPTTNGNGSTNGQAKSSKQLCPDCSGILTWAEGCLTCHSCGFTKCG